MGPTINQDEINAILWSACDTLSGQRIDAAWQRKKGLMQRLLTGRMRVRG